MIRTGVRIGVLLYLILAVAPNVNALQLLLVPQSVYVLPDTPSKFDVYVYNDTKHSAEVPSLESFVATYVLRSRDGGKEMAVHKVGRVFSHSLMGHKLAPGNAEHTTMELPIDTGQYDLVELDIHVGEEVKVQSNTVLLLADRTSKGRGPGAKVDKPAPASSPKAAVTPEGKS